MHVVISYSYAVGVSEEYVFLRTSKDAGILLRSDITGSRSIQD